MKSDRHIPPVLRSRPLFYYAVLTLLVALALSPLMRSLPFRVFLASLSEQLIVAEVNPYRESVALPSLRVDALLSEAARMKAEDMIVRDYFTHLGPSGELPWVWFEQVGYSYTAAGENLAIDFADPDALVQAWLASPSHAENIKSGVFTDIGIGVADGDFRGRNTAIVVMFLGKRAAAVSPPATVLVVEPSSPPSSPSPLPATVSPIEPQTMPEAVSSAPVPGEESLEPQGEAEIVHAESQLGVGAEPDTEALAAAVSPEEPLITKITEEDISVPVAAKAVAPGNKFSSFELKVASSVFTRIPEALRILLSILFAGITVFSLAFFVASRHRSLALLSRAGFVVTLFALLWLPEIM